MSYMPRTSGMIVWLIFVSEKKAKCYIQNWHHEKPFARSRPDKPMGGRHLYIEKK